eukprot:m.258808 g.258808  ORF g.258808 m.258808 type:complete len:653 (+) comp19651_c0_seq2:84-2042(+)
MSSFLLLAVFGSIASFQHDEWAVVNNTNAAPGPVSNANSTIVNKNVESGAACFALCKNTSGCSIFTWSPNSHNCYFRGDHLWTTGWPNEGYFSGCIKAGPHAIARCAFDPSTAACPADLPPTQNTNHGRQTVTPPSQSSEENSLPVKITIGSHKGETSGNFRMLGFNFDFWPSTKPAWGTCGVLTSVLEDKRLRALTGRIPGALLRIGGSPADFMLYDVFEDACSAVNLNKTQSAGHGYFCPIWDQVQGQCLTQQRWRDINAFALASQWHIAFDLNACWGRPNASAAMDMSMIFGLFNLTAHMAAQNQSAVFAFQFGNELYGNVEGARYGADLVTMAAELSRVYKSVAPHATVPGLIGPDNGMDDMSGADLMAILDAGAAVMTAASYHDYWNACCSSEPAAIVLANASNATALNVSCLDDRVSMAEAKYLPVTRSASVPLWISEGALHASSGVAGLTNTYTSSLFYAHALGELARRGIGLFSRQTLLGGNYEIIDRITGLPNPDYWVAVLWHDLIGASYYDVTASVADEVTWGQSVRVHVHNAQQTSSGHTRIVLMVNFAMTQSFSPSFQSVSALTGNDSKSIRRQSSAHGNGQAQSGNLYQLTGHVGELDIFLNGEKLALGANGELPAIKPVSVNISSIVLPPCSISFLAL